MKPNRDAAALAASLTSAAAAPLPLPSPPATASVVSISKKPEAVEVREAPQPRLAKKAKPQSDTVQTTLRPERQLMERYVNEAAERTKKEGRVVSAQQIMLEVLATGPKVQK
jgi:hypothetical protein